MSVLFGSGGGSLVAFRLGPVCVSFLSDPFRKGVPSGDESGGFSPCRQVPRLGRLGVWVACRLRVSLEESVEKPVSD